MNPKRNIILLIPSFPSFLTYALRWPITLPPIIRLNDTPKKIDRFKKDIASHCNISPTALLWEPHVVEGYEIAEAIFRTIKNRITNDNNSTSCFISFPAVKQPETMLMNMAQAIESNGDVLGVKSVGVEFYPAAPAPVVRLDFREVEPMNDKTILRPLSSSTMTSPLRLVAPDQAIKDTEQWVDNFLCRYRLCPYTATLSQAAVGLSSVNIRPGPIRITSTPISKGCPNSSNLPIILSWYFWSEVKNMLQLPEEDVSTVLLVAPDYDNNFMSFASVCDNIIESFVVATESTKVIGRAWFHPNYNADEVKHDNVIAGHAVPHSMVRDFVKNQVVDSEIPDDASISKANDMVRKTPHATINILRRSQLLAAGKYEAGLKKKPDANSIYVKNVMKICGIEDFSNFTK